MSKKVLETVAVIFSVAVIGISIWFWRAQVIGVLELLEIAYG